ncbi:MAG TPA: erythromycin esterase family protein [Pyrinomonadaceae bacterium]|nr:erythromycin esterase family protein [Pyrinomonadaceae bacterium]
MISLTCYGCSLLPQQPDRDHSLEVVEPDETAADRDRDDTSATAVIRQYAHPLTGAGADYDPLMKTIGDARFVLLGEATHGTHEFYRERAKLTRRLIEEKGFSGVVLEADWTDAFRVNEFVLGAQTSKDKTAEQSLAGFTRFPLWMWRNRDFRELVAAVRAHNDTRASNLEKVGVYGMDIYGFAESLDAVIQYLGSVGDKAAAARAKQRYNCFRNYREQPERYGLDAAENARRSCEKAAAEQFQEMESRFSKWLAGEKRRRNDPLFSAYQNARVVKNAEAYYRLSYNRSFSTWNLRDSHMSETLLALARYLDALGDTKSKLVVWAHNTHQGDARMTEMGEAGELNVGHLMRQATGESSILVGFTTYTGKVTAAAQWGAEGRTMQVRPALEGSYSKLFHDAVGGNFLLIFRGNEPLAEELARTRLERAIGVVYLPKTERQSHYFEARMSRQFDAVIHFDVTSAVKPLFQAVAKRDEPEESRTDLQE